MRGSSVALDDGGERYEATGVNTLFVLLKVYCDGSRFPKFTRLVKLNASKIRRNATRSLYNIMFFEKRISSCAKPGASIVLRPIPGKRSVPLFWSLLGSPLPTASLSGRPLCSVVNSE